MLNKKSSSKRELIKFNDFGILPVTSEVIALWEHFQSKYDFSSSLSENLAKLSKCDLYKNADLFGLEVEVSSDEQPENLQMAKQLGVLSAFDKAPTKTQLKKLEDGEKNVTLYDLFKSNALSFLSENQDSVNQYAQAWAYRLILDHEETTAKNLEPGHIDGIARDYGFDTEVVEDIYGNTYGYKKERGGIDSYTFHETHLNIDLFGDAYQEGTVYSHMAWEKEANPYVIEPVCESAKELNSIGMMRTTWIGRAREELSQTFERVRVNSYSQRQVASYDFESRGRENFLKSENKAMLKLKNLPDGAYVKLMDMPVEEWFKMSQESRLEVEEHVKNVIDAAMLDNGLGNIKDADAKVIMANLVHSDSVKASIEFIKKNVGSLEMNNSEPAFKLASDKIIDSLVLHSSYKLPMNKWMNHQEIDLLESMIEDAQNLLEREFDFAVSPDMVDEIKSVLSLSRLQFDVFDHMRVNGKIAPDFAEKYAEVIVGPMKSQVTRGLKELNNKSDLLEESFPELASTLTNKKENPLGELLKTREVGGAVQKMEFIREFARQNMPEDYQLQMQEPSVKRKI